MDIVVVGAGIIGASVAHELADRGCRVRVIDGRGPGRGATFASAGMLAPHIEGHAASLLALGLASLERYDRFVLRVCAASGRTIEYRRNGSLQVARSPEEHGHLEHAARRLRADGVPHDLLGGADARRREPRLADDVLAGLFVPSHGYVRVSDLVTALVAGASELGVEFERAEVLAVEPHAGALRLRTSTGQIAADAVVVASGTWPGGVEAPEGASPVRPIRGQLLRLRSDRTLLATVLWGDDCYMVPWTDDSVLVGATVEDVGFDESATAAGVSDLLNAARRLVPAIADARFQEVRVGLRPATRDELPIVGRSSTMPQVVLATGHYRNGVLLAPLTAELVADLILENREPPELSVTRPDRFGY